MLNFNLKLAYYNSSSTKKKNNKPHKDKMLASYCRVLASSILTKGTSLSSVSIFSYPTTLASIVLFLQLAAIVINQHW